MNTFSVLQYLYPRQWQYIQQRAISGILHHAYGVIGVQEGAQEALVDAWSEMVFCTAADNRPCGRCTQCVEIAKQTHPDRCIIDLGEQQTAGVDEAKVLRMHLHHRPTVASHRIAVLHHAERMSRGAANALLKLIEEPPRDALFFLSTSSLDILPATVRSRIQCVQVPILPDTAVRHFLKSEVAMDVEKIDAAVTLSRGRFQRLLAVVNDAQPQVGQWKTDREFWIQFIVSTTAQRDQMIQKRFFRAESAAAQQELHGLAPALSMIEELLHQCLLIQHGLSTSHFSDREFSVVLSRSSVPEIEQQLCMVQKLQEMAEQHVNKKMIFEYLTTSL